jgi:uncharacterized protein (DUF4415 family)
MSKKPNPELINDDNPEWTDEDFARAKRFADLPKTLQAKLRGRPKADVVKARLTIRMDAEALARWRASGPGWQTRAAELLAAKAPRS